MRPIVINARAAARPELGGVERWAREMVARLPLLEPNYVVARPGARLVHRAGHAWEQVVLPARATRHRASLILSPANLAPLAWPANVVVIHDAAALRNGDWYSPAYVAWQRRVLPRIARGARHIVTVSVRIRMCRGLMSAGALGTRGASYRRGHVAQHVSTRVWPMSRMRALAWLSAAIILAVPAASHAQGAADNQYQDPFGATKTPTAPAPSHRAGPRSRHTVKPVAPDRASAPTVPASSGPAAAPAYVPPAATVSPAGTSPSAYPGPSTLPRTGADSLGEALLGGFLLLAGLALRVRLRRPVRTR